MSGPSSIDVLVVGDANPDLLLTGDVVPRFGQAEQILDSAGLVLGGSAGIVAAGLARLGVPTALVAAVGADDFGTFTRDRLAERGVDVSLLEVRDDVATGVSVILSLEHDRSILTLPGTIPLLRDSSVSAAIDSLSPRHVHLASYFLQPELADELPAIVADLRNRGVSVSLDTNWDPSERWEGLRPLLGLVDYLMPNKEEALAIACAVAERDITTLDEAASVLSSFGSRVIVKAGVDGGIAYEAGALVARGAGLAVEVVDTTGAGDSFDAGYLAAILSGIEREEDRLAWAAAAGSLSVRGIGGTAAQATRDAVLDHLAIVE